MKNRMKWRLCGCAIVLLIVVLTSVAGVIMHQNYVKTRQKEAGNILHFYSENILLQLRGSLNEADTLAKTARAMKDTGAAWFEKASSPLLERKEVLYVCLFEGDTLVSALPKAVYGNQVGSNLKDFSYIYTMAKVVKDLVVEGPVVLEGSENGREVFLFLQPVLDGTDYLGEVAVALDFDYVLEQLELRYLHDQGYDYELWRVDPQNGGKEVITASRRDLDFSEAVKTSFHLPTEWNLSIQPIRGWVGPAVNAVCIFICIFTAVLLSTLVLFLFKIIFYRCTLKLAASVDARTGLLNQEGFTAALDRWLAEGCRPVILFYFVYEEYNQISQMIGSEQKTAFLREIPQRLQEFIQSPFLAGRVGAGNYIVAVREDMDEQQQEDFAKGLSLELLMKIRLNGSKHFLTAHYQYLCCWPAGGRTAAEEITSLVQTYYARKSEESPVMMLTEKCRQLIAGKSDVTFDEYTDQSMTELSKTFNQYRKQVEQLAYFDPVFNVGNRPKYLRDANMLISYDKKRPFSLICVDVCAFNQYNQLFSVDIGDEILHELVRRLSRQFGTYLYRLNGDVFLGISLSGENAAQLSARLEQILSMPVSAGNASFSLQVRIVVCQYPANGCSPEVLLDRVQSALRYAKESDEKIVIYDDTLDKLIQTETDILHQLKSAIQQGTLEVWYQPLMDLKSGEFNAIEALVRLPDGKGNYFSTRQVIALAERSGMVEQLGDYVLGRACQFLCSHGKELGICRMGVNLSVQQLLIGNCAAHLLDIIHTSGASTDQITLEVTESILIQSIEQASEPLDKLRQTGIHISLDDFGVGYSSLNYLSNLPVDVIKIDRSLTRQICTNKKQRALLHSIVEMAEINSLTVVSEGIETEDEQKLIAASGVQYIQGYYYAGSMQEDELIRFLNEKKHISD